MARFYARGMTDASKLMTKTMIYRVFIDAAVFLSLPNPHTRKTDILNLLKVAQLEVHANLAKLKQAITQP